VGRVLKATMSSLAEVDDNGALPAKQKEGSGRR